MNNENEKFHFILNLLLDEDRYIKVVESLINQREEEESSLFQEFIKFDNFLLSFDKWIRIQTQPFLSLKINEEFGSLPSSSQSSQSPSPLPLPSQSSTSSSSSSTTSITSSSLFMKSDHHNNSCNNNSTINNNGNNNRNITFSTNSGNNYNNSNRNYRNNNTGEINKISTAPSLSGFLPSNLSQQQIFPSSSSQSQFQSFPQPQQLKFKQQPNPNESWPSLSESTIQSKQVRTNTKKKRITPTVTPTHIETQPVISQILTPSTEILPPPPPISNLIPQMSTSIKTQFDLLGVKIDVFDSREVFTDPYQLIEHSYHRQMIEKLFQREFLDHQHHPHLQLHNDNHLDNDDKLIEKNSKNTNLLISRLSQLYYLLIRFKYLPILPAIVFLSRLLSLCHTFVVTGKNMLITIANPQKFPTLLLHDQSLAFFLTNTSLYLVDIIQSFGDQFCGLYAELLAEVSPTVSQILLSRPRSSSGFSQEYNELYLYLGRDNSEHVDVEEFIRPFHEDRDNRNGYKGKVINYCITFPYHYYYY